MENRKYIATRLSRAGTKRALGNMIFSAALYILPMYATQTFANPVPVETSGSAVKMTQNGVSLQLKDGTMTIEPWAENIVRVRFSKSADWAGNYNPAVIATPSNIGWKISETANVINLQTSSISIQVDKESGEVTYKDKDGNLVLKESRWSRNIEKNNLSKTFDITSDEAIYGLGQHQGGQLDYRGTSILLEQINTDVGVPMLVSSKGYGILWNNAAVTRVDVATAHNTNNVRFKSEAGGGLDYHVIVGAKTDDVIAGYRKLTGQAPLMARWTWGLWQSREHYRTQEETVSIVNRYRDLKVPFDVVVQDWQYWTPGNWGSHEFDKSRFPDPAAMVKSVHDKNAHIIISVWPRFDLTTANHDELKQSGTLFEKVYSNVYPAGEGRWYDAWSAKGREIYWRQIMNKLGRYDFDGWWLDGSEAELGGQAGQMSEVNTAAGPGAEVFNSYPLMHTGAVHDGMRRDMPQKRPFILTRSAYAGQQRNAAITWSGDTIGNWDIFAKQIPAALNFSISGIPYWSADIGGFFGGEPKDPEYSELFVRWYQFGVFNPMFRVHGTGASKSLWDFDTETQKKLIAYDELRYRLLPYIYSTSWDVTHNAGTMMRPLVMDFKDDKAVLSIRDQYMFGRSFMVSPVIQPHADVRTVYLPKGDWYDFWSGSKIPGGKVIASKADINTIPLHIPAGTILPLGPIIQYADQKSNEPLELRIYPGKNAQFELYDDAGDGYGYQKGQYSTVNLNWDDVKKTLAIESRTGSYLNMKNGQDYKVVCVSTNNTKTVKYTGKTITITMPDCM